MAKTLLLVFAATALFAADDPWTKVKDLKSGTELQVFRRGAAKPLDAKFADVQDESLVVVIKNEQRAIPKNEIDRIDYRPGGRSVTKETKHAANPPDTTPPVGMNGTPGRPNDTWSSGVTYSKPGFETIYKRPAPAPKK